MEYSLDSKKSVGFQQLILSEIYISDTSGDVICYATVKSKSPTKCVWQRLKRVLLIYDVCYANAYMSDFEMPINSQMRFCFSSIRVTTEAS